MEDDEGERHHIEGQEERRLQPGEELRIGLGPVDERAKLPQIDQSEEGHEDAGDLAQDERGVRPVLEPPPDRDAAAIPAGMVERVVRPRAHRAPHGRSRDFTHWVAPVSLYCWIAPAGSTCFGHTFVHSPTNVHCQMPSWSDRMWRRSAAPWSRESML